MFYVHYKGKTQKNIFLWSVVFITVKVAYQFAIRGLVAYKPIAYKKR